MSFEMTPAEAQQYGDSLSFWQKLALLQAYAPLIGYVQKFATEGDPFKRGRASGSRARARTGWMTKRCGTSPPCSRRRKVRLS
jgi:hypothetical protein